MIGASGSQGSAGRQPGTPSVGSASAGNGSASVPFTAPSYLGKPNTPLTYRAFTQPVTVRSTTGTISNVNVLPGGIYSADITGMSSTTNLFENQVITATNGTGSLGAGTVIISKILSSTSVIVNSTAKINAGTITNILGGIIGSSSTSPISVTGLTNGTSYNFRVSLTNDVGTSLMSSVSNSVTPSAPTPNFPNFPNFPDFPNFPNFSAPQPNFPNFAVPNFPNFTAQPNFPNFTAQPNFPNFAAPPNFTICDCFLPFCGSPCPPCCGGICFC